MKVVFMNTKGGPGKSTMATNVAASLATKGIDVALLDTDGQATAKNWIDRRNESGRDLPAIHAAQASGDAFRVTQDLARRYEEVIVDTAGVDSKELRSSLMAADIVIVPTKASTPDLEALFHVNELLALAKGMNPNLKAYAVVSMAPTNPQIKEVDEAKEFLQSFSELELLPVFVRERKAYRDAMFEGLGVVEYTNPQAAAEIQALTAAIYKRV